MLFAKDSKTPASVTAKKIQGGKKSAGENIKIRARSYLSKGPVISTVISFIRENKPILSKKKKKQNK